MKRVQNIIGICCDFPFHFFYRWNLDQRFKDLGFPAVSRQVVVAALMGTALQLAHVVPWGSPEANWLFRPDGNSPWFLHMFDKNWIELVVLDAFCGHVSTSYDTVMLQPLDHFGTRCDGSDCAFRSCRWHLNLHHLHRSLAYPLLQFSISS